MRYSRAVIERFYAHAHPKCPNRQQANTSDLRQWFSTFISTGRTMVQVQESRACY